MVVPLLVAAGIGLLIGVVLHHTVRPHGPRRGDRGAWFMLAVVLAAVAALLAATGVEVGAAVCVGLAAMCVVLASHPPTRRRRLRLPRRSDHQSHQGHRGRHVPGAR